MENTTATDCEIGRFLFLSLSDRVPNNKIVEIKLLLKTNT